MKARAQLTATELAALHEQLDSRLSAVGIETQPAIAASILDLTQDPDAGMNDFARIIRNDPGLTGRLIRLANSAYFAQRKPVTTIDRACVLLGMERVRSISLGFYLSRAAAGDDLAAQISREVWGQSVFRACLAAQLAKKLAPDIASEAFVVGLMLDAGAPLAHKLLGPVFESLYVRHYTPSRQFNTEHAEHPYTHVDIITVLVKRWKFPDLLAKPIAWHHAPPPETAGPPEPIHWLHRIAYYAGAVALAGDGTPTQRLPMASTAKTHLGLDSKALTACYDRAAEEYEAVRELFAEVADPVALDNLASRVHTELIGTLDDQMESSLADAAKPGPQEFSLGGLTIVLRPEEPGTAMAFSYDRAGEPLSAYRFRTDEESADTLRTNLGLDQTDSDDVESINEYLQKLAA